MPYSDLRKGRTSLTAHAYCITTVTHRRALWFSELATGRIVVAELRRLHDARWVESLAFVLMPDHLHWLFVLGAVCDLGVLVRTLKGRTARAVNCALQRTGPLWQRAYYDHALRSDEDLRAVARYIVANPLRARLVNRLGDYPLWDACWL
jgi:REP element-mobilizing transposase RayT